MSQQQPRPIPHPGATSQRALEARLADLWARNPAPDATVEEAFGPFESWTLDLDACTLLLDPVQRQWLYFDRVHGTWEPTGFGPGEVTFSAAGAHLGYRRTAAAAHTCSHCGAQVPPGGRFCTECGAEARPTLSRCAACGADNRPGSRFCSKCGTPLQAPREV